MSETKTNIYSAMIKARGQFETIVKTETAKGEKFSWQYANLEQVIDKTSKGLSDNDLVIIQFPINEEGRVGVLTILHHAASGETLEKPFTTEDFRKDPQGIGMVITYFRRYAWMAVCGLAPEDDDGVSAMPSKTQPQASHTQPEPSQDDKPSDKQLALLKKNNIDGSNMTKREASKTIGEVIAGTYKHAPEDEVINPDDIPF